MTTAAQAIAAAICVAVFAQLAVIDAMKDTVGATLKQSGPQAFAFNPTLTSNGTQVRQSILPYVAVEFSSQCGML